MKRNVILVVVFVFLIFVIIGIALNLPKTTPQQGGSNKTLTTTTSTTLTNTTSQQIFVTQLEWRKVASWNGSGIMNTETFGIIGNLWRVRWNVNGSDGLFMIAVNDEKNNLVSIAADIKGNSEGTSYFNRIISMNESLSGCGGEVPMELIEGYYLKINSTNNNWSILIEEEAPNSTMSVGFLMPNQYVAVASWSGLGIKETEEFNISSTPWLISWKTNGSTGMLHIFVYDDHDNLVDSLGNSRNKSGYSYMYSGIGEFYLKINSDNSNWEINVKEPSG